MFRAWFAFGLTGRAKTSPDRKRGHRGDMAAVLTAIATVFCLTMVLMAGRAGTAVADVGDEVPSGLTPAGASAGRPIIRAGYVEAAPYSSSGPAGLARGYSVDLLANMADIAGYDLRFVRMASPDAAAWALVRGDIDALTLIAVTPARGARVAFTEPVARMDFALISRAGDRSVGSAADLSGKRVGVRSGTLAEGVAGGLGKVEIARFDSTGAMTMALLQGEVDAVLSPPEPIWRMASQAGIRNHLRAVGEPLEQVDLAFAVSPDRPELLARLNRALSVLRASGELEAIRTTWFGAPPSFWDGNAGRWAVAGVGWLVAFVAVLAAIAAERRARLHIERVTRARDRLALAHSDLARSNEHLAQANEQLERFANVAAHDLRAPLRALMTLPGWVREELGDAGVALPGEVSRLLDDIFDQAASMDRMLKDLLDYARLGGDDAARRRFQPAERIREIARMAGMPDEFTLEIAPELPELELSTVEFDTVMRNLLSNAVKHHDQANGRIEVRGWREAGGTVLEVADDGPGIAREHRERVFEIFSTLGPREKTDGGGMGLAFVRRIVESWGGSVVIDAPREGRGAIFRLRLPGLTLAHAA